jgi:hypothetical protein
VFRVRCSEFLFAPFAGRQRHTGLGACQVLLIPATLREQAFSRNRRRVGRGSGERLNRHPRSASHGAEEPLNSLLNEPVLRVAQNASARRKYSICSGDSIPGHMSDNPPLTGRSRHSAHRRRKGKILKPAPIGRLIESLLRALLSLAPGRSTHLCGPWNREALFQNQIIPGVCPDSCAEPHLDTRRASPLVAGTSRLALGQVADYRHQAGHPCS